MFVKDLQEGTTVDGVLVVREAELRSGSDGCRYLRLLLGDRTGALPSNVFDDIDAASTIATVGASVHVSGRLRVSSGQGAELTLDALRAAVPGTFDESRLQDGPPRSAALMEADLRELVATVQDRDLRRLLDAVLGPETPTWERYRTAPAAKRFHQAYRHGLLEHSLSVAQAVSAISATFAGIDRDVAVTGALLHDIGKLDAYAFTAAAIEMTDAGKLHGEIPLGYFRVRRAIDELDGFARPRPRPCCTSSSATTAASSTAAPSCRARARPRSCTSATTSAAGSGRSTASRRSCRPASAGRASTARSAPARTSRAARRGGRAQAA